MTERDVVRVLVIVATVIVIGVIASLVDARRRPTCAAVTAQAPTGVWVQVLHGETPRVDPLPDWAVDVQVTQCRDGVVRQWRGTAPQDTTTDGTIWRSGR